MKRFGTLILLLLIALHYSCAVPESLQAHPEEELPFKITLTGTKGDGPDSRISRLAVFLFDERGLLENEGVSNGSGTVTILALPGTGRTIYAIANLDIPPGSIPDIPSMERLTTSLTDNDLQNGLVMVGKKGNVSIDMAHQGCEIEIGRTCARIILGPIHNSLEDEGWDHAEFKLLSAFMKDVPSSPYGAFSGSYSVPAEFYRTDALPNLLIHRYDALIPHGESSSGNVFFYLSPTLPGMSCCLVIEILIGGITHEYEIHLEDIRMNMSYEISSVRIRRVIEDGLVTDVAVSCGEWTESPTHDLEF